MDARFKTGLYANYDSAREAAFAVHGEPLIDASRFVQIDLSEASRGQEVREYAQRRGLNLSEAIIELMNAGLSHLV
jgi:hypothetical protein